MKKFKWKRAIKRTLKETKDGQMKIKRLKKAVIGCYLANGRPGACNEDLDTIFTAKLHSLGLQVDGKIVRLK